MQTDIYYYGVGLSGMAGHRLWGSGWRLASFEDLASMPWPRETLDGGFLALARDARIGEVVSVYQRGWTALSWWDTSGDARPGSHSTFLLHNPHHYDDALSLARIEFPEVFDRIKFDLRPYEPATGTDVPVDRSDGLTEDEGRVMDALAEAANGYQALDRQHPSENSDFVRAIHQCQDLLAVRIARRHYPEGWPTKS